MLLLTPLIAMLVTVLVMPLLVRIAPRAGLLDIPDARKAHAVPIPQVGGLAIVTASLVALGLWLTPQRDTVVLLAGGLMVALLGAWDDRRALSFRVKFAVQIAAALLVVLLADARLVHIGLPLLPELPLALAVPLSVFVLVGITNAVNLSDGLDGLAGGTTLLVGGMAALLAFQGHLWPLCGVALAVVGGILGFLRFNTHPAVVFMGDAGAYFIGFVLCVVVIRLGQTSYTPTLPLLLFGMPIFDTAMVMLERIRQRRSPFSAGRNHTHHKLIDRGLTHYEAVMLIYLLNAVFIVACYMLRFADSLVVFAAFAGICAVIRVAYSFWLPGRGRSRWFDVPRWIAVLDAIPMISLIAAAIPVYLVWTIGLSIAHSIAESGAIPLYAVVAIVSGVVAIFSSWAARATWCTWLQRSGWYLCVAAAVLLGYESGLVATGVDQALVCLFAVLVMLGVRKIHSAGFRVTPMDVLLLLVLCLFVGLLGHTLDAAITVSIIKLAVMFYAVEIVVTRAARSRWRSGFLRGSLSVRGGAQ